MPKYEAKKGDFAKIWQKRGGGGGGGLQPSMITNYLSSKEKVTHVQSSL